MLPGQDHPQPASIFVDVATGKITDITHGQSVKGDFPDIPDSEWIDAGDRIVIPGIVE